MRFNPEVQIHNETYNFIEVLTKSQVSLNPSLSQVVSHPVPRKKERSLHTCAQDVQITRMATI
jgi:hypothetical protein